MERDDGERVANDDGILSRAVDLSPEAFRKVSDLRLTPLDKACMHSQQNNLPQIYNAPDTSALAGNAARYQSLVCLKMVKVTMANSLMYAGMSP